MYDEKVKGYWHIYSDGKKADIPFSSDEDKTYAMNSVAICAYACGMEVICLEINDTHLHTVLYGCNPILFKTKLKRRITVWENKKEDQQAGDFFLACDSIETRDELLTKIIYTFRNCLDFFKSAPWEYRWGVGNLFFAKRNMAEGTPLGKLSFREQYRMLESRYNLPPHWRIDNDGLILPSSYIDAEKVERLFGSVRAFLAFLFVRKEDEIHMKQQFNKNYLEQRRIEDMRQHANGLSHDRYGHGLKVLSLEQRLDIGDSMLKKGVATKSESFAKALYLKKEDLDRLL